MKKNRTASATISQISHDGRGIAHVDGKLVFIRGALPGEEVVFRYLKQRSTFDEGQAIEIIKATAARQVPKCQHFGVCGGCDLQHASSAFQLEYKQQALLELLTHQAHTAPQQLLKPLCAENWAYRRKGRLSVKYVAGKNKVLVGFREKDSHFVANLERCEILDASVGTKLTAISELLYELSIRHKIAQIEIAVDDTSTALIVRNLVALPPQDREKLLQFAEEHNYKLYLQPKGLDSVHLIYPPNGNATMRYDLNEHQLHIDFEPTDFVQINREINHQIINASINLLALTPQDTVLDLFCGIGNFSLPIAKYSQHVTGVEASESAVARAHKNATLNHLNNTHFYCEDLFKPPFQRAWSQQRYDKLLLDPPRSGAQEIMPSLKTWAPQKILYISCNPATLARDTALILKQGYSLEKLGIANMFPHTKHIEAIALFNTKKS